MAEICFDEGMTLLFDLISRILFGEFEIDTYDI